MTSLATPSGKTDPGSKPQTTHLEALTALRFFAAGAIVLFHLEDFFPFQRPYFLSHGVSFFFVLSGFILTYIYTSRLSLRDFLVARFARVWPVHFFCFLLTVTFLNLSMLENPNALWVIASNLTLTQSWFPFAGFTFSFNGPSWSISNEFFFYLMFPLLLADRSIAAAFFLFFAVALASIVFLDLAIPREEPELFNFLHLYWIYHHPVVRIAEFAIGVMIGRMFVQGKAVPPQNCTWIEVSLLVAIVVAWVVLPTLGTWAGVLSPGFFRWIKESGAMPLYAALIYIFAFKRGAISNAISNPLLILLGKISFSTYMIHHILIRIYRQNDIDLQGWLAVPLLIFLSYALSYAMWLCLEEPARRAIVRKFSQRKNRVEQIAGAGTP